MTLITAGMGAVLKHIKKAGKAVTKAGDKWHVKTQKLQRSKKKIEKIKGAARIGVPMTVAVAAGAALGVKDAKEEIRKRTHAAGQIAPARSLLKDIKSGIKKVKEKVKKK